MPANGDSKKEVRLQWKLSKKLKIKAQNAEVKLAYYYAPGCCLLCCGCQRVLYAAGAAAAMATASQLCY